MNTTYPNLDEFLGAYFHQDWTVDEPTADGIVEKYLSEWPKEEALLALNELDRLLGQSDNEIWLRGILDEMGCYYNPAGDSLTCAGWLGHVREKMAKRLLA
jgi:CdiI immunity protein